MIVIPAEILQAMRRHAETAYPEECCGVVLGTIDASRSEIRQAVAAEPLPNARLEERTRRFVIEPDRVRAAEADADRRGLVLLGFYHSHPDHPARPSRTDLENALPWHSYVIVGVTRGEAGECTSWILSADRTAFEPEEVAFP